MFQEILINTIQCCCNVFFLGIKPSTSICFFLLYFASIFSFFFLFQLFLQKIYWKSIFQPGFGVSSTQTLVKIHNPCSPSFSGMTSFLDNPFIVLIFFRTIMYPVRQSNIPGLNETIFWCYFIFSVIFK